MQIVTLSIQLKNENKILLYNSYYFAQVLESVLINFCSFSDIISIFFPLNLNAGIIPYFNFIMFYKEYLIFNLGFLVLPLYPPPKPLKQKELKNYL